MCSRSEAFRRLIGRWTDHVVDHPDTQLTLKDLLTADNIEACGG